MAIRVCLPALGNNLVNLVKTTNLAYAIAVPELLYVSKQIWSDATNVREMMIFVLVRLSGAGVRPGRHPARHRAPPRHPRLRPGGRQAHAALATWPCRLRHPSPRGEGRRARRSPARLLFVLIVGVGATIALAQQPAAAKASAIEVLMRWAPLLLWGFAFNILISLMAMAVGTVAGLPVGIAQLSRFAAVRVRRARSSPSSSATRPGWCCCSCACS